MSRHRRLMAALAAMAAVIVLVGIGFGQITHSSSTPKATDPPAQVNPADVDAARACQAFTVYLDDASKGTIPAADGKAVVDDATVLLGSKQADEEKGRPLPKWAALGADLLNAVQDVISQDTASLKTDGTAAAQACQTIPAAAARAGGYLQSTPSS